MRVEPAALEQLLHPTLDPDAERDTIARDRLTDRPAGDALTRR